VLTVREATPNNLIPKNGRAVSHTHSVTAKSDVDDIGSSVGTV